MRRLAPATALVVLLACGASPAQAAQRWASPDSTVTDGSCPAIAPCSLPAAVNSAAAGDEVVVSPGTYTVSAPLDPQVPLDIHGVAGQPRPRLRGTADGTAAVLSFKSGGTLSHLRIEGVGPAQDALTLQGAVADDLILGSVTGDGGKVVGSASTTVLRDSVVHTASTAEGAAGLKVRTSAEAGDVLLANLTVLAPAAAGTGIRCEIRLGQARLLNTLVRGGAADVADTAGGACVSDHSDFRPGASPGMTAGPADRADDPLFRDADAGDYRPAAGSPTIDAGVADPQLGAIDPAGCPRTLGSAPDIGAYEYADDTQACSAAPAEPPAAPPAPGSQNGDDQGDDEEDGGETSGSAPAPRIGTKVVVGAARGTIRVKLPGAARFSRVDAATAVPVGSVVDATAGRVRLVSAIDAAGTSQTGTFWGSRFRVRQSHDGKGMTILDLRGGSFAGCRRATASAAGAPLASIARRRHRRVRSLWARDHHGRFRTHGANSVATARGTHWQTVDRCDGTVTRVKAGAVAVRDLHRHRTVLVRAGHRYLARTHR